MNEAMTVECNDDDDDDDDDEDRRRRKRQTEANDMANGGDKDVQNILQEMWQGMIEGTKKILKKVTESFDREPQQQEQQK